ncbi:hypothetical protein BDR26DRAFT_609568 [Obelidium mucronatum]|nr:hypothetical protein BDR26DRAFT_609568 [Obelidium mucronatum]
MDSSSIVVLLDSSCDTQNAIETAVNSLSYSSQDRLTVISIVESTCSQRTSLVDITTVLKSMQPALHPATQINLFTVPENACQFQNSIHKLVIKAQPELMILALNSRYSSTVFAYTRNQPQIVVKHLDAFEAVVPDEESRDWVIRDSARCSSPIGWD